MSLLFPLYLLGALAVGVPLYLHLQRRPPKDTVPFSSLRFLKPVRNVRVDRKNKLEHLWLLALRILAVLFLVGMFARPFLKDPDALGANADRTTILLLDRSASMRREGLWEAALEETRGRVEAMGEFDGLGLMAFDHELRPLVSPTDWKEAGPGRRRTLVEEALAGLRPGWGGSDLGNALAAAADWVPDSDSARRAEIVVIGDLQAGSDLDALRDRDWPTDLPVVPAVLEPGSFDNATLNRVAGESPRVRAKAGSEFGGGHLEIGWEGQTNRLTLALAPGDAQVLDLPPRHGGVARLTGDGDAFDNDVWFAGRAAVPLRLLYLGDRSPDDPDTLWYYFERAFPRTDALAPELIDWSDDALARADFTVLTEPPSAARLPRLRKALKAGARMLLVLRSVRQQAALRDLAEWPEATLSEKRDLDYALLEDLRFDHELLAAFRAAPVRDFTKVRTWRYRRIEGALPEHARALARFDTGDPAWLEFEVGAGRLLVMAAGWHPDDGQLARSTKFVPLLFSMLEYAGRRIDLETALSVGETLPWSEHLSSEEATLTAPGGEPTPVTTAEAVVAGEPGLYTVATPEQSVTYAVNLDPRESELAPLDAAPFEALGIPFGSAVAAGIAKADTPPPAAARQAELERRQRLWRYVVLALMLVLILETLIASRTREQNVEEATTPA